MLIASALLLASPVCAQFTTASLGGTVIDPSGASIPDAKISVENRDTALTETTTSGNTGVFLFSRLPVGNYKLTVEKQGFTTYVQDGITLAVNQAASLTVPMQVGRSTEQVTVTANADLVTTREATVNQLIDQKHVLDLPLDGRRAQSLVYLAAGTVNVTSFGTYCDVNCEGGVHPGEQRATVNGIGPNSINYQLDGSGHNDTYINTNLPFPNPDAIQEFNLQSDNLSAEYGNGAAGAVNIVTKSGTNQFHGDAFEFVRNGSFNARNFFADQHDSLKRNQFGGSLGGPIKKDRAFFFGTYQGTRIRTAPEGQVGFVPTGAERGGDFSDYCPGGFDAGGPLPCRQRRPAQRSHQRRAVLE